ncbi:hypothetical protein EV127DRAFT_493212 [Xylaria flabelliformis]|nr:hypothetical protein EV127DRAFT_493212 [Xylaria flabelliformis]
MYPARELGHDEGKGEETIDQENCWVYYKTKMDNLEWVIAYTEAKPPVEAEELINDSVYTQGKDLARDTFKLDRGDPFRQRGVAIFRLNSDIVMKGYPTSRYRIRDAVETPTRHPALPLQSGREHPYSAEREPDDQRLGHESKLTTAFGWGSKPKPLNAVPFIALFRSFALTEVKSYLFENENVQHLMYDDLEKEESHKKGLMNSSGPFHPPVNLAKLAAGKVDLFSLLFKSKERKLKHDEARFPWIRLRVFTYHYRYILQRPPGSLWLPSVS